MDSDVQCEIDTNKTFFSEKKQMKSNKSNLRNVHVFPVKHTLLVYLFTMFGINVVRNILYKFFSKSSHITLESDIL